MLNASGGTVKIKILTNDTFFLPCSVSLYFSLPRKLIGLLGPSSPVRLIAASWSLPDWGWWRQWDFFWFCFTPIGKAGLDLIKNALWRGFRALTWRHDYLPIPVQNSRLLTQHGVFIDPIFRLTFRTRVLIGPLAGRTNHELHGSLCVTAIQFTPCTASCSQWSSYRHRNWKATDIFTCK